MKSSEKRMPAVSVVIPMYNCESFVPELLQMFADQSFTDFEVICVIDGATDGTEKAVEAFCKTDSRFRYIVRENGGAGAARNTGLDTAKGKYIVFPDADDEYGKDYLLKLYKAAEAYDADIVVSNSLTFDYPTGEISHVGGYKNEKLLEGEIYSVNNKRHLFRMIGVHVGGKMYRCDFIRRNTLLFSETKAFNDVFFSKATIIAADRIVVVNDELVTIRRCINSKSITATRGMYAHLSIQELRKLYQWIVKRGEIGCFVSDFFRFVDATVSYEMRNGVNPLFSEAIAHMLNCEAPWKNLKVSQIVRILKLSFRKESFKNDGTLADPLYTDKIDYLKTCIENKTRMQELIKKTSLEIYGKDLDEAGDVLVFQTANNQSIGSHAMQQQTHMLSDFSYRPSISVVIPMFNRTEDVRTILSSFANQSFLRFEVICVIYGDSDNTQELVSDFSKRDQRFRYIVTENRGLGAARNTGLDMARGEYIVWADADYEYSTDYLRNLYETAIRYDAQIVVGRFEYTNGYFRKKEALGFSIDSLYENIVYSHQGIDDLFTSFDLQIPNKLLNIGFVRKNGLRFNETRINNDGNFALAALSIADRILVIYDILLRCNPDLKPDLQTDKMSCYIHEEVDKLRELYQWLKDNRLTIHKEDYLILTKYVLKNYGRQKVSPRFISEFAHMINEEEPWKDMPVNEILNYLEEELFPEKDIQIEAELSSKLSSRFLDTDKELSSLLRQLRNKNHTVNLLKQVSKEKYGRDFLEARKQKKLRAPKVSVIIPVYNVRNYIERCINALKSQTLSDMEFIFIDDCSTDGSMKPVDIWANTDRRVRIVRNKENIGSGRSRNKGIEAACGEYIAFADADDWMKEDFYKLLYLKATKGGSHDISKGRCCKVDGETGNVGEPVNNQNERIRTGLVKGTPMYCLFTYEHWTAIYNKRLFCNEIVRYGISMTNQDTTFLLRATYHARDIVIEDTAIYYYLQRSDSAVHIDTMQRTIGNLDSVDEIVGFLLSKPYTPKFANYLQQSINSILRVYQNSLGKGLISKDVFGLIVERISSALKRFPDYDKLFESIHSLNTLIKGRKFTKALCGEDEKQVRISVIIPVYNPGDAIKKCIESLRQQLLAGLEFIFVDDASTDKSIEYVEQWASDDNRVMLIYNEKNLGPGASRNEGIKHARGEYLAFIDPDDYVSSDYFELLYAKAKDGGHDIAKGSWVKLDVDGTMHHDKSVNSKIINNDGQRLFNIFLYQHTTAIYKRKLFEDGKVCYGSSKKGEDSTFLLRICYKTNDVVIEAQAKYHYIRRLGSLNNYPDTDSVFRDIDSINEKIAFLNEEGDYSDAATIYIAGRAYTYWTKYLDAAAANGSFLAIHEHYKEKMLKALRGFFDQRKEKTIKSNIYNKALIEYGTFLPNLSKLPQVMQKKAFSMWTEFLSDNHELDKDYIDTFINQATIYIRNEGKSGDLPGSIKNLSKKINKKYYDYLLTKLYSFYNKKENE